MEYVFSFRLFRHIALLAIALVVSIASITHTLADEVNIYSYREPQLMKPLFDAFEKSSGIEVQSIHAKSGLVERLQNEGKNSPADLLLVVDISSVIDVKAAGLSQKVDSPVLQKAIPARLRDPQNHWFGVTQRARIIVSSRDRVKSNAISSYAELADPQYKGKICTRSGKHNYMIALFSSQIAHNGVEKTERWLEGLHSNLARKPQGNDRAQIRAVAAGECDFALVNHYYLFVMHNDPKQRPDSEKVRVVFPDQNGNGVHMNISGMAMTAHAPNKRNAKRFMEFVVSEQAQRIYADTNGEFPVVSGIKPTELVQSWGDFKQDSLSLEAIANERAEAIRLVNRINYDK